MDTAVDVFAGLRREVRYSLHGRTLEAVTERAAVYARWVARAETARGAAYLAEYQRIADLMKARGWDVYRMGDDNQAR